MAFTPEPSAWRIDRMKWASQAFTGLGASFEGGRWNPPGVPVVYVSRHLSMAAMEKLVHLPLSVGRGVPYVSFRIHFERIHVEVSPMDKLPEDWDRKPPSEGSQRIGLEWVKAGKSAILQVPSVIIPTEDNFLLNPAHPDFKKLRIDPPEPFGFDPRLLAPKPKTG